jgi:hypothetical protein
MERIDRYNTVKDWVEDLPERGKITFTQKDIEESFPSMPVQHISIVSPTELTK